MLIISSGKQDFVSTTHEAFVEVDLSTGEEIFNIPWFNLCKKVNIGDFVEIKGGSLQGQGRWVEAIEGLIVHIIEQSELEGFQKSSSPDLIKVSGLGLLAAVYTHLLTEISNTCELLENYQCTFYISMKYSKF